MLCAECNVLSFVYGTQTCVGIKRRTCEWFVVPLGVIMNEAVSPPIPGKPPGVYAEEELVSMTTLTAQTTHTTHSCTLRPIHCGTTGLRTQPVYKHRSQPAVQSAECCINPSLAGAGCLSPPCVDWTMAARGSVLDGFMEHRRLNTAPVTSATSPDGLLLLVLTRHLP